MTQQLNAFRNRLNELCKWGDSADVDEYLRTYETSAEDDLRTFMSVASTEGLAATKSAIAAGLVIRHAYKRGDGSRCIAGWAMDLDSNRDLFALEVPDATMAAISRTIRRFDQYLLADTTVQEALDRELARREAAELTRPDAHQTPDEVCVAPTTYEGETAMDLRATRAWADLNYAFWWFPVYCLQHVLDNRDNLISGAYSDGNGKGCLFYFLSELLPEQFRIRDRASLTRYFTGSSGYPACDSEVYAPPRWIVRLIDRAICPTVAARYPGVTELPYDAIIQCLQEHLQHRKARERRISQIDDATRCRRVAKGSCRPKRDHRLEALAT